MSKEEISSVKTISAGVKNTSFVDDVISGDSSQIQNFKPVGLRMTDEVLLSHAEQGGHGRLHHKATNFGHSEKNNQPGVELRFEHLDFRIKGKQILEDVSGAATPGKILAVMGPSGSGKTTLLNILGGRTDCPRCHATIGGEHLTKQTRRKISYVLQEDIFFPNLTLQQTLQFAAELRLPESLSTAHKKEIVNGLIEQLDMKKCTKTIIGDSVTRGLSGGEKKRANIANELLTDPAVLLLDEPTSGLDSSTAYALTLSLKKYAVQNKKTVMMTIHQPSIQIFFQFDTVLLLSGGRVAYYGSPEDVLKEFANMGFACDSSHYNPADFILDVVKSGSDASERLIEASNQRRLKSAECPVKRSKLSLSNGDANKSKYIVSSETKSSNEKTDAVLNGHIGDGNNVSCDPEVEVFPDSDCDCESADADTQQIDNSVPRWPTSYLHQTKILTVRSFIQGKYRYLSKLKFIKTIGVAVIMGLIWFQLGRGDVTESKVNDIVGALFFLLLFNSFNSLFDVLVIFPSEREVVNKERMSGSYRLSAYYVSKTFSELPLCLVLPSLSTIVFYWMAGLNGFNNAWAFFGTWFVMIGTTIASQSLGLFISAATMDFDHALVLAIFIMISFMLLGGFYVKNFPYWIQWLKYISPFMYSWSLMLYYEFDSDSRVVCSDANSAFPSCANSSANLTITQYAPYREILDFYNVDTPAWVCWIATLVTLIVFRVIGYYFLRLLHKPITK